MIKTIANAYGAGFRAGMSQKPRIQFVRGNVDRSGAKTIVWPSNPFTKRLQILQRFAWELGSIDGQMKQLSTPIKKGF